MMRNIRLNNESTNTVFTHFFTNICYDLLLKAEKKKSLARFLFCLIFQFYLMYRLIRQKPAHFFSAQMALVSTFFQMFVVLGMYNFGFLVKWNLWPVICLLQNREKILGIWYTFAFYFKNSLKRVKVWLIKWISLSAVSTNFVHYGSIVG